MSKTTKIIAALGVVAGLGVAALPAFTYAVTNRSVEGAVKLDVEVLPSLAMTIHSNGDPTNTYYAEDPDNAAAGYGIDHTTIPTNIEYTKDGTSGLFTNWSSATTSLLPNAKDETMTSTVTVYTNAGSYALSVADEDSNNNLVGPNSATIAPIGSSATLTEGTAGGQWGIKGGDVSAYTAVPVSTDTPLVLVASGTGDDSGDDTTFTYGVATDATQAVGHYQDVIVYTATASN